MEDPASEASLFANQIFFLDFEKRNLFAQINGNRVFELGLVAGCMGVAIFLLAGCVALVSHSDRGAGDLIL